MIYFIFSIICLIASIGIGIFAFYCTYLIVIKAKKRPRNAIWFASIFGTMTLVILAFYLSQLANK
jgi:hypothetical protein